MHNYALCQYAYDRYIESHSVEKQANIGSMLGGMHPALLASLVGGGLGLGSAALSGNKKKPWLRNMMIGAGLGGLGGWGANKLMGGDGTVGGLMGSKPQAPLTGIAAEAMKRDEAPQNFSMKPDQTRDQFLEAWKPGTKARSQELDAAEASGKATSPAKAEPAAAPSTPGSWNPSDETGEEDAADVANASRNHANTWSAKALQKDHLGRQMAPLNEARKQYERLTGLAARTGMKNDSGVRQAQQLLRAQMGLPEPQGIGRMILEDEVKPALNAGGELAGAPGRYFEQRAERSFADAEAQRALKAEIQQLVQGLQQQQASR